jgi:hypothetical protein
VEVPASALRLTGVSHLGRRPPHDVRARFLPMGAGAIAERALDFRIDDLVVEVPAFRDAMVIALRQHFPAELVQYVAPPAGGGDVRLRATVTDQSVALEWDRNPAPPEWRGCVAWVQRLPGDEWLACTPGTALTDPDPPPGRHVYMVAWRESPFSPAAFRGAAVAAVDVPDAVPDAPAIVRLRDGSGGDGVVLWARSAPAADVASREWERRAPGGEWRPLAATEALLLEDRPPPGGAEYRVRLRDRAGQAGPFSEPAAGSP